jgi:uncharacterized membrane protein YhhN
MKIGLERSLRVSFRTQPELTPILSAIVAATLFLTPRPGQEGMEIPVVIFIALVFLAAHWFHLWMIEKSLKKNDL